MRDCVFAKEEPGCELEEEEEEAAAVMVVVEEEDDEEEAGRAAGFGATHDAVPGMEVTEGALDVLVLPAVEELSSAWECGMHTESGATLMPSMSAKWGNSTKWGRWGIGATVTPMKLSG